MKTKAIPSIHISLQEKDGSVAWVWYLFFQWLAENVGKVDLSDYFTKEETEALLDTKVDKTDTASQVYGTNEDGEQTTYNLSDIGGNIDIDEITITKNVDDEIQAEGVINHNEETDATNPIYDWVGTLAEYEEQNIENEHPDWICYITDDFFSEVQIGAITEALNDKVDKGHQLIEWQEPTSTNNYTWYRLYADDWVEQGGEATFTANGNSITLPIAMADTHYVVQLTTLQNTNSFSRCYVRDTTYIAVATSGGNITGGWQVSGMAA